MFWIILIIIVAVIILFSFFSDLNKDNYDLQNQTLAKKFQTTISIFNEYAFTGQGQVTELDKKSINLYKSGDNQIIYFEYSTGHLTITWKYKYFQKEIIHKKEFPNVRNLSIFEQQKISEIMISEMAAVIENHQKSILGKPVALNIQRKKIEDINNDHDFLNNTVNIGDQVWMVENLNVSHFRNGDPIFEAKTKEEWKNAGDNEIPAWCHYNNDPELGEKYGKLYNWYAINESRGLAPDGWHVPSNAEWEILTDYLGGEDLAGGILKESGTSNWKQPNNFSDNMYEFKALPGGCRNPDGTFNVIVSCGYWWCTSEHNQLTALCRKMLFDDKKIYVYPKNKDCGFSVRCIRDFK